MTVRMNTKWDLVNRFGLDIQNSPTFFPAGDTPKVFDRTEITERV